MVLKARQPAATKTQRLTGKLPDRYDAFMRGEITIDDMDEEELMRGQFRNKNGDFRGGMPKLVPREFAQALQVKQQQHTARRIAGLVDKAFATLESVMENRHPQPGEAARVKAAQLIIERYLGRVPETVNLKAEISTWNQNKERFVKTVHIGELLPIESAEGESDAPEDQA